MLVSLSLVVLSLVSIGLASLNFQHNTLNRTNVRKMIYNNLPAELLVFACCTMFATPFTRAVRIDEINLHIASVQAFKSNVVRSSVHYICIAKCNSHKR